MPPARPDALPVRSLTLVALGATLWGCWSLFLRPAGLGGIPSAFVALLTMALPAPFVLRRAGLRDAGATRALVLVGLADAANCALYFEAVQRGPVAVAVLTHYLAPLLVALAAPLLLRERLSLRALAAGPVTLVGLALLIGLGREGFSPTTAALGTGSAVFFLVLMLATKVAVRAYSPLAVVSVHAVVSAAALLAVFGARALPDAWDGRVAWVVAGAAVCGVGGTALFNTGLRGVAASLGSALTYLEPLVASAVGALVWGEALGPWGLVGGLLVLAAGAWVALERPRVEAPPAAAAREGA